MLFGTVMSSSVSFLIVIVNMVIRTINIKLIDRVGYNTLSVQTSMIMKSIFYASFINTGIILLLTNSDLQYSVLKFIPIRN